ncbi:hypothetical protein SmJEL517_g04996 [Synchytrium microbalum]|uniref:Lon protease homolog, mitochondrial n=1 Tax=Synchytrium microbalum TaxID=1806994 RepID=A0A507BXA3_9FUNG|nr:uncharacterized protein SmJEL517_g04996 [Synchytrium microbalum]TPX31721.1 hypothetical protein SmJEL517_g04996 [Synchytrium microbalum]
MQTVAPAAGPLPPATPPSSVKPRNTRKQTAESGGVSAGPNSQREQLPVDKVEPIVDLERDGDFGEEKQFRERDIDEKTLAGDYNPRGDEPVPTFTKTPEVIDDFIRNYLVNKGMFVALDAFQNEWHDFQQRGRLTEEDVILVPDVYQKTLELEESLRKLRADLDHAKTRAVEAQAVQEKLGKERDFHRMHHKRVVQEKARLVGEVRRLKEATALYEPELKQMRHKYEVAMKEKMMLKLERDRLHSKVSQPSKDESKEISSPAPKPAEQPEKPEAKPAPTLQQPSPLSDIRDNPYLKMELPTAKLDGYLRVRTIKAHDLAVSAVKFHPKKMIFATVSDDKTWKMWSFPSGELIMSGRGHRDWIGCLDFHPKGAHLATASGDSTIKIWDFTKGVVTLTLADHRQAVWACAFQDGGDVLASGSQDATVKLWDVATGRCKTTLRNHTDSVCSVAWQPYSNLLVTTSADKNVCLWDARSNLCVRTFSSHQATISCASFALKGQQFATCDTMGIVKVWDARNMSEFVTVPCGPSGANRVCFDPSGYVLAVASDDGFCRILDLVDPAVRMHELDAHEESVQGVAFDRSAESLVTVGSGQMYRTLTRQSALVRGQVSSRLASSTCRACIRNKSDALNLNKLSALRNIGDSLPLQTRYTSVPRRCATTYTPLDGPSASDRIALSDNHITFEPNSFNSFWSHNRTLSEASVDEIPTHQRGNSISEGTSDLEASLAAKSPSIPDTTYLDAGSIESHVGGMLHTTSPSPSTVMTEFNNTRSSPYKVEGNTPPSGGSGSSGSAPPPSDDSKPPASSGGSSSGGDGKGRRKGNAPEKSEKTSDASPVTHALERVQIPPLYPQLLAIPLTRRPLFPGFYKSLYIKDPQAIQAIQSLMDRRQPWVGVFLSKDNDSDMDVVTDINQVHDVGVFAQITNVYHAGPENSALTVVVFPHRRIRATSTVTAMNPPPPKNVKEDSPATETVAAEDSPVLPINQHLTEIGLPVVNVDNLVDETFNPDSPVIKATTSEMLNVMRDISAINSITRDQVLTYSAHTGGEAIANPAKLSDFAAAICSGDTAELQAVLESTKIDERLQKALLVLKKELANAKLQKEISQEVDKKITRKQQEYYLMEQLKGIKKELGLESDGKDKLVEKFKERATHLQMPDSVKKVFDEELNKLQHLEPAASEFNVTRNYLDWITQIPWGKRSEENFDIKHAMEVLDEDHYGLKDVKDRILEFIAVGKLRGTVEGKIICLVGPPGVGKTSVGKSIAHALGREFFRFSVGGLTDVAEIKGHRRTYVGAMPGKVIQALKKVQTENPLIMIDEIDKLGRGHQGDPASALLELLDPEQNNSFLDHYMDIPIDLSKTLFVCTANMLETIPAPLLDRMEVITLSGYVAEEKVAIASKYLAPAARTAAGLDSWNVTLANEAIETLIRQYCREAGVRNLKKHIEKVYRKAALKIVREQVVVTPSVGTSASSETKTTATDGANASTATTTDPSPAPEVKQAGPPVEITSSNLKDYVGSPVYTSDRMYDTTPSGVVMGLAWTSMGGSALYVESVLEATPTETSKSHFHRTGQMGDVMKESSTIAYTYARSMFARKFPANRFFDRAGIHMHVPEGATPKDGPSAGVTMTTSLVSLALNTVVLPNVAMTGEITLTGKVLKIGGVKEKTIAAKRSGVTTIIFPKTNQSDWDELADYIKEGMDVRFVEYYDEIFDIVFPDVDLEKARKSHNAAAVSSSSSSSASTAEAQL